MSVTVQTVMDSCTKTAEVIAKIPSDKIPSEKTKEIRDRLQKTYDDLARNKKRLWLQRTRRGRMLVGLIQEALTKMLSVANEVDREEGPKVIQQLTEDLYDNLSELESHVGTIVWEAERREIQYT